MNKLFHIALTLFAFAFIPVSGSAQDVQNLDAAQVQSACSGTTSDACTAVLTALPLGSELREVAVAAAIRSGMSDGELEAVVSAAALTGTASTRIRSIAVQNGRTSRAILSALSRGARQGAQPFDNNDDDDDEDDESPIDSSPD